MSTNVQRPSITELRRLSQLTQMDQHDLEELAKRIEVFSSPKRTTLVELGSHDETTVYLLEGRVDMVAEDGHSFVISSADSAARSPLCHLRPARYNCRARTDVRFLRIDDDILDEYLSFEDTTSFFNDDSYKINEPIQYIDADQDTDLMARIYNELNEKHLLLPSLPEVAFRVGRAAQESGEDAEKISNALMSDPAMAIKLIKAVNARLQPGETPVKTVSEAVERLGNRRTIAMVVKCVLRETAHDMTPLVDQRLSRWWHRAIRVSNMSYMLASETSHLDPELAALAGLVHDIGELAILAYSNEFPALRDAAELDATIEANKNEIGRVILTMWDMPYELVLVAAESSDWMREYPNAPDYADVVIIALMHALIADGHPPQQLPPFNEVPAFERLGLNGKSPEFSMRLIDAANKILTDMEVLMAA